jgi:hypothetical protein
MRTFVCCLVGLLVLAPAFVTAAPKEKKVPPY